MYTNKERSSGQICSHGSPMGGLFFFIYMCETTFVCRVKIWLQLFTSRIRANTEAVASERNVHVFVCKVWSYIYVVCILYSVLISYHYAYENVIPSTPCIALCGPMFPRRPNYYIQGLHFSCPILHREVSPPLPTKVMVLLMVKASMLRQLTIFTHTCTLSAIQIDKLSEQENERHTKVAGCFDFLPILLLVVCILFKSPLIPQVCSFRPLRSERQHLPLRASINKWISAKTH